MEELNEFSKPLRKTDQPDSPFLDTEIAGDINESTGECYYGGYAYSPGIYCLGHKHYNCMNGVWNPTGTNC